MKIVLACLFSTFFVYGEGSAAQLYGQVFYTNGWPVAYQELRVLERNEKALTDSSGAYFLELPPGSYSLTVAGCKEEVEVVVFPPDTKKNIYLKCHQE